MSYDNLQQRMSALAGSSNLLGSKSLLDISVSMATNHFVAVFLIINLVTVACNFVRTVIQYRGSLRASNRLFLGLLEAVCHAPIQFFEVTLPDQIMSRFTKDIETLDSSIGWHVNFLFQTVLGVLGVVTTIGIIVPEFLIACLAAGMLWG